MIYGFTKIQGIVLGVFCVVAVAMVFQPTFVNAIDAADQPVANSSPACTQSFLTFPAWYRGLIDLSTCELRSPADPGLGGLPGYALRIGVNIVEIVLRAVGYASVGFIIYGGYKYMTSAGSPDGMAAAKKTIMNAVIGLVISLAAVAIVNTIANAFYAKSASTTTGVRMQNQVALRRN